MRYLTALALALTLAAVALPRSAAAGKGGNPSVTGQAKLIIGGELRSLSFSAVRQKDGTVTGQAELNNRAQELKMHVEVNCLHVNGNIATLSGPITESTLPSVVGRTAVFRVVDNGQGANDPRDLSSLVKLTSVPCEDPGVTLALYAVDSGDIQVQP